MGKVTSNKLQATSKKKQDKIKKIEVKSSNLKDKSSVSDKKVSQKQTAPAGGQVSRTMSELMARKQGSFSVPKRGAMIWGTITEVTSRMVLIDIGAKTEGMVIDKEFDEVRDFVKSLKAGEKVEAYVLSPENERGQILLALRNAAAQWQWKQLEDWMKEGKVIEARGLEVNRGGLVARIDSMNIHGFIPTSQLGGHLAANLDDLINRVFSVKIIEVDRQNNRLIFSERYVSEKGEIEAKKKILAGVKVGLKVKGKVVGLTDFGAFAKATIDGQEVEGLVHISELAWDKIDDAASLVKEGDEIDLKVIDINPQTGKVGFSAKQLLPDPWNGIESRYPLGKKLSGVVSKIANFGAIIQLEPGVSGLLHISKIPTAKEPVVGDTVEVVVEDLDVERRKLALGMAREEIPIIYR